MTDGVYQVTTKYLCAGFVVENGTITTVAPALRRNLFFWVKIAKRVDGHKEHDHE